MVSASTSSPATPVSRAATRAGRAVACLVHASGTEQGPGQDDVGCADETASMSGDSAARTASSAGLTA